jgi:membrane fusion protein (multidrug efflux system)
VLNDLNTIKADADLVKAQIAKTEIRAPFNGTIGLRSVNEGSYIAPTSVIASIQDINPVKIDFAIPERYLDAVKVGNPVMFTIPGSGKKYSGKIYAIEPKIDIGSRTIKLRAICDNTDGGILPGSFAQIQLELDAIKNAIMIPTEAVIPELKGQKVFIAKEGKAVSVKVETGLRNDQKIQITSGLSAGDTLIITGIMQLKKDAPVKVKIK